MKRVLTYAMCLAVAAALPWSASAQQSGSTQTERGTKERKAGEDRFVMHAAEDNLAEVQLGKLASERASSDEVKKFGERMASDHQKAYDDLKKLAESKGMPVPTELQGRAKNEYDRLSKLSGADFDRAYMARMVRDHDRDVRAFERAARSEKDADVKAWAAKTLPTLQEHQREAKQIDSQVRTASKGRRSTPSASPGTSTPGSSSSSGTSSPSGASPSGTSMPPSTR
jgi:putative membrane protein